MFDYPEDAQRASAAEPLPAHMRGRREGIFHLLGVRPESRPLAERLPPLLLLDPALEPRTQAEAQQANRLFATDTFEFV